MQEVFIKKVRYILVKFPDIDFSASDLPKLRGYFASKYPADHLFHNHLPDNTLSYKMPLIQYRIIDNHPALIGINEGIDVMKKVFFEINSININGVAFRTTEREISVIESGFGICEEYVNYRFNSPWMALNEENHVKYLNCNPIEKNILLKRILRQNLKTLSKGFDYWIKDFDGLQMDGWFKPMQVKFKDNTMTCFKGEFTTNFAIPPMLGVGKQSARGFGVIEKI